MPERVHGTSSVPDFSTYPEEPAAAAPNLEATYATYRRYSETNLEHGNRLADIAARLGNSFGNAVSRVRDTIGQARNRMLDTDAGPAVDLRTRIRQFAQDEPLKVILAAGAVGVVAGAAIRIWRGNDQER